MKSAAGAMVVAARAALAVGDTAAAEEHLREALKDHSPEAHRMLGGLLFGDDDLIGARSHWEQAFREWRDDGEHKAAALVAADLADLYHGGFGNHAAGQGWVSRARRLLEPLGRCVEWGYVELAFVACYAGDPQRLERVAGEVLQLAIEFGDSDLEVRALADGGYALVVQGRPAEGFGRLDEAMAALSAGEVRNPAVAGKTFCALLTACERAGDVRRAEEWTHIIASMVLEPLGGRPRILHTHCRMVYGSVLCSVGRRPEGEMAMLEVVGPEGFQYVRHRADAVARFAELRLQQGRIEEATELLRPFRDDVQSAEPVARLHLLAGEYDMAAAVARRAMESAEGDRLKQAVLLGLLVEVELGRDDVAAAGGHAEALRRLADAADSGMLRAEAALAEGRVAAAGSDVSLAITRLQNGLRALQGQDSPLLYGTICLELAGILGAAGDMSDAVMQARSALAAFDRVGATLLAARTDALLHSLGFRTGVSTGTGVLDEVQQFVTGTRTGGDADRVLVTVLFTDIVNSTARAAEMGDHEWRALLDRHDAVVVTETDRLRGRVVKSTGDGVLATFGSPGPAVRCAGAIRDALRILGIDIRAGLHTGEVEVRGTDIGGIAVHLAQRLCTAAEAGEIVVSSTVKDLVAGSGLAFADRGLHELRGIPDQWQLFRAMV
jgi:class 3 adenylate cyclase/tetratricopeptide (TPR) repeat protein